MLGNKCVHFWFQRSFGKNTKLFESSDSKRSISTYMGYVCPVRLICICITLQQGVNVKLNLIHAYHYTDQFLLLVLMCDQKSRDMFKKLCVFTKAYKGCFDEQTQYDFVKTISAINYIDCDDKPLYIRRELKTYYITF